MTGASGYVGGRIANRLASEGWSVVRLGRHAGEDNVDFRLGEPVAPESLRECTALVHCAYDFTGLNWSDVCEINVQGTLKLFQAARKARVRRIVLISTLSAFAGCRSLYGKAKLQMEEAGTEVGAWVIRPGLVFGWNAGGLFGRLAGLAKRTRLVPIPSGGKQLQYLVHHDDLAACVLAAIERDAAPSNVVSVSHDQAWPLREIIRAIGRVHGRSPTFIPCPWRLAWMGLRAAEFARLPIGPRSDSLLGFIFQNPNPTINVQSELGINCRAFDASLCFPEAREASTL